MEKDLVISPYYFTCIEMRIKVIRNMLQRILLELSTYGEILKGKFSRYIYLHQKSRQTP